MPETSESSPRRVRAWLVFAAVVTLAVHARGIGGEPVYLDDNTVPWVETPGFGAGDVLAWTVSALASPGTREPPAPWAPVPAVLLALTRLLGDLTVPAMHALALLAHAATAFAVGRLALALRASPWTAVGGALLFGTHPVTAQGTAWISAFPSVLAGLFGLLSLVVFARAGASRLAATGAGALLLVGLLCNPVALAALPMAVVVWIGAAREGPARPEGRGGPGPLVALAPLVAAVILAWVVRAAVFGSATAGFAPEAAAFGWRGPSTLGHAVDAFGGSLRILAWPDDANLFRAPLVGAGLFDAERLPAWGFTLGLLVTLAVALGCRARALAGALGLLGCSLLPLAVASEAMAVFPLSDHHLVLAAAAFAVLVARIVSAARSVSPPLAATLLVLASGAYAWLCQPRIDAFRDDVALLGTAAGRSPESPYAQWVWAHELLKEYRRFGRIEDLEEAHEVILRAQDLLERSREPESTVLATSEDFLQTNLGLGWCLLALSEVDPDYDPETAHAVFEKIAESHPDNVQVKLGSGLASLGMGDVEAAEASFRDALRLDPDSADAYGNLGRLAIAREDWAGAQGWFEKALARRPSPADRVWLARALYQQGWVDRALAEATAAHELDPYHPDAMVLLGVIALAQERLGDARDWIDRALRADPDDGFARLQRGRLFEARGDLGQAVLEYRRATAAMPTSFEAFTSLGNGLLRLGEAKAAAEQLVRAYELRPPSASAASLRAALRAAFPTLAGAHFGFAGVDYARGDLEACREWIASALAIEPTHAGALHLRGIVERDAGELEAALGSFRAALASRPDSFQVHHDLAYLLIDLGRADEALPHLRRALELVPPTPNAPEAAAAVRKKLTGTLEELSGSAGG